MHRATTKALHPLHHHPPKEDVMHHREKFPIHPSQTPAQAYAFAMRHRLYRCAAIIARDFGLGDDLVHAAAFSAFCLFDDLGEDEAALRVAGEFGLTVRFVAPTPLFRIKDDGTLPPLFASCGAPSLPC
jgi:hypothetical protein